MSDEIIANELGEIEFTEMLENEHYTVIPAPTGEQDFWVDIVVGEFKGTRIRYGNIYIDGKTNSIIFDLDVMKSDIPALSNMNERLQKTSSLILQDIINNSLKQNAVEFYDTEDGSRIEY